MILDFVLLWTEQDYSGSDICKMPHENETFQNSMFLAKLNMTGIFKCLIFKVVHIGPLFVKCYPD